MKGQWLALGMVIFLLSGCISTQSPSSLNQLQIKVAQLERKVQERDAAIETLKTEMQDLSNQVEDIESFAMTESLGDFAVSVPTATIKSRDNIEEDARIIRVDVDPKKLQQALKNSGYYKGTIDGKVGSKSKEAIAAFQKDHGLTDDGIVGKRTWAALKVYLD